MNEVIFLVSLFLFSFGNGKRDPVISEFSTIQQLKGTVVPVKSINLGEVVDLQIMDSILILNEMFSDKVYKAFNINTGKLMEQCINRGRGPLEVSNPGRIHFLGGNRFAQYDRGKKQLDFFSVTNHPGSTIRFSGKLKVDLNEFEVYPVNDSILICTGIFEGGRYCLYKSNYGESRCSGEYPDYSETRKLSNVNKAMIYQPAITLKPDHTMYASFEGNAGYFEIIHIDTDRLSTVRSSFKKYSAPIIQMVQGNAVSTKDNLFTFHSAVSTDDYIYTIYAGRSREEFDSEYYAGNNLLVYDWQGHPVIRYQLDRALKIMTLDTRKMRLFGYRVNPQSGEPEIIKYQLPVLGYE